MRYVYTTLNGKFAMSEEQIVAVKIAYASVQQTVVELGEIKKKLRDIHGNTITVWFLEMDPKAARW